MSRNPPLCVVGHQAPDEAGQLSRYGGYRHISLLLSMGKTTIFAAKPFVRLVGIGYNLLATPRLTGFQLLWLMSNPPFANPLCRLDIQ